MMVPIGFDPLTVQESGLVVVRRHVRLPSPYRDLYLAAFGKRAFLREPDRSGL